MALTLTFRLDNELYGLEIDTIQEIIEDPLHYYVPLAQGVLKGAINFHGQILAVIDLPELLGIRHKQRDHRQLVLTPDCKSMVLLVSCIERIVNIDLSFLDPPEKEGQNKAVRGTTEFEDKTVKMLDTNQIIDRLEMTFAE
jgi:purine-binding chemotaxis protein CheW